MQEIVCDQCGGVTGRKEPDLEVEEYNKILIQLGAAKEALAGAQKLIAFIKGSKGKNGPLSRFYFPHIPQRGLKTVSAKVDAALRALESEEEE